MFKKFFRKLIAEEVAKAVKIKAANDDEALFSSSVNLHERSAANKHERLDGSTHHGSLDARPLPQVATPAPIGYPANPDDAAPDPKVADAAALLGRGGGWDSGNLGIRRDTVMKNLEAKRKAKRDPVIVDPTDTDALLAAMKR